jgi:hypothetical protein
MSRLTGNFNNAGTTNISDAQYLLNWIAGGGNSTKYNVNISYNNKNYIIDNDKLLLDPNKNGTVNISDAQYILNWIAAGGNSTKIGEYLPYNGKQYIIEYVGEEIIWNTFLRENPHPKYRFFIELYNIPKDDDTSLGNLKNNDGIIINNVGVQSDKISSKSTSNSGYITKYEGDNNIPLNSNLTDPFNGITLTTDTFYHKSLIVPMNNETATLKDIILYIFLPGNSHSNTLNNTGIQVILNIEDLVNNPTINNNDTIIIDHQTNKMYMLKNNSSTTIDLTSKVVDGVLFS